ncbi:MAG TPA: rhodanese-like domain-containing protein, partial [Pyrinomonadaceae bacterium]|nr:rhodanese-like domain-containing protein [Pyrinomonadaceae bacterium]
MRPKSEPAGNKSLVQIDYDEAIDAPGLSITEAGNYLNNESVVFIDLNPKDQFESAHIPGAVSAGGLDDGQIAELAKKFSAKEFIIFYCSCRNEHLSARMVSKLQRGGMLNTRTLIGGFMEWRKA